MASLCLSVNQGVRNRNCWAYRVVILHTDLLSNCDQKLKISGQSNLAKAASKQWLNQDCHLTQCSLGPQESPLQAGARSVQPFARPGRVTDWRTTGTYIAIVRVWSIRCGPPSNLRHPDRGYCTYASWASLPIGGLSLYGHCNCNIDCYWCIYIKSRLHITTLLQLNAFRELINHGETQQVHDDEFHGHIINNYRPPQPLNNRVVIASFQWTTAPRTPCRIYTVDRRTLLWDWNYTEF